VWLVMGCSATARAAELTWSAPAGCADAPVRAQVEQLLQRTLANVPNIDLRAGRSADAQAVRLSLRTQARPAGHVRTRELLGNSCAELQAAAAVAIAMTISASEQPSANVLGARALATSAPQPRAAPAQARPPLVAAAPRRDLDPVQFALGAGLTLDRGVLPRLAPGAELALSLRVSRLRVVALAALFGRQSLRLPDARGEDFALALGALLACADWEREHWGARACAGFELARLAVRALGVRVAHDTSRLLPAPRAELAAVWRATRKLRFLIHLGAALPLARDEFVLDDSDHLYTPRAISLRATLDSEYTF
jgi:hypothetical protein